MYQEIELINEINNISVRFDLLLLFFQEYSEILYHLNSIGLNCGANGEECKANIEAVKCKAHIELIKLELRKYLNINNQNNANQ